MDKQQRSRFIQMFLPGIIMFVSCYLFLTAFRDFRDNFSAEVWNTLGYGSSPSIFTKTEIPISIIILVLIGSVMLIKSNYRAFMINHFIIACGLIITGLSTYFFQQHFISAPMWMTMLGMGLYMGYVPFNSIFFERMLATFQVSGTVGFVMYIADSFGYLGSVAVLLYKEFTFPDVEWVDVFVQSSYLVSAIGLALTICSMVYFHHKYYRSKGYLLHGKNHSVPT